MAAAKAIKHVSMSNQPCSARPMLIDLNLDKRHYYPFIMSMSRCNTCKNCNTVEDPFGRICIPNKLEYVNMKVFGMIKEINDSKTLTKYISCEREHEFDGRKYVNQCAMYVRKMNSWNCSMCACKCDKDCDIGENLKNRRCMKMFVDDLVVTCAVTYPYHLGVPCTGLGAQTLGLKKHFAHFLFSVLLQQK